MFHEMDTSHVSVFTIHLISSRHNTLWARLVTESELAFSMVTVR